MAEPLPDAVLDSLPHRPCCEPHRQAYRRARAAGTITACAVPVVTTDRTHPGLQAAGQQAKRRVLDQAAGAGLTDVIVHLYDASDEARMMLAALDLGQDAHDPNRASAHTADELLTALDLPGAVLVVASLLIDTRLRAAGLS